ncbi:MAG: TolC family protein [Spirochaetales bacterium]|nr:TolC family protein [Spirochaetales bacterium]
MKRIVLTILGLSVALAVSAQTRTINVDEAVSLAIEQNLSLMKSGVDLATAKRAKDTAWNSFLPSLQVSGGFGADGRGFAESNTNIGDPGTLGVTFGLSSSLNINAGLGAGIRNLIATYEAGLISYEDAKIKLERDVRKQFYQVLANQENIRIAQANIDLAEKRLEQAKNNFANGLTPELEVLKAEVTVANLRPPYDNSVAGTEALMLGLKFLMGEDRNANIVLEGELETSLYDIDAENIISKYLPRRLDIQALDKQLAALEYAKSGTQFQAYSPTINLGFNYNGSANNANMSPGTPPTPIDPWQVGDKISFSIGLGMDLSSFIPGSSTDVNIKKLQDSIDSLVISRQMAYENAGIEITNLVNNLKSSRNTIEANTSSVELAKRTYDLTEEAYSVGTKELLDVETAQNEYLTAVQQLLMAKYNYLSGLLDLEYALNTPIEEFVGQ